MTVQSNTWTMFSRQEKKEPVDVGLGMKRASKYIADQAARVKHGVGLEEGSFSSGRHSNHVSIYIYILLSLKSVCI